MDILVSAFILPLTVKSGEQSNSYHHRHHVDDDDDKCALCNAALCAAVSGDRNLLQ